MTGPESIRPRQGTTLRLWPGVLAVTLQWLLWLVAPIVAPESALISVAGAAVCGAAIAAWWLFFSRAPWADRLAALGLMIAALLVTRQFVDESIADGLMGMMLFIYAVPALSLALVASAVVGSRMSGGARRVSMAAAIVLACGVFTLLRTGGITGDGDADLHWRWTPTPEERLLADSGAAALVPAADAAAPVPPASVAPAPATVSPAPSRDPGPGRVPAPVVPPTAASGDADEHPHAAPDGAARPRPARGTAWPGFRGPARDGAVRGLAIDTDWAQTPPVEIWRQPIGPGWSSFAVDGGLIYTQEQRGEHEVVSSYRLATGEPVWRHADPVRFYESNGGPGPRGTPTVRDGRVYTLGATGLVNALDAATGTRVWSRDGAADTGTTVPDWGFASSPLVVDDVVIVALAGRLIAYDAATGAPRWLGPEGGAGYSSPHLATIDGVAQVLLLRGSRTVSVSPADGALLWEHVWQPGSSIVQPAVTAAGEVVVTVSDAMGGLGIRLLAVARSGSGWTVEERWTSRGLKPYFNDYVLHEGHVFGFDGSILACVDLRDGARKWKGGRYGNGQLVLLPEGNVLLVLSEEGELALVKAAADQFTEIARIPALDAKTWNHPAIVGDVLLVRNGEEMAAYRLATAATRR